MQAYESALKVQPDNEIAKAKIEEVGMKMG